jgi:xanthine dehydrogenase accessory factor
VVSDSLLAVIRGGGDLATGVAWRLTRAGVAVLITELPEPLTVRRTVALSQAVYDGKVDVEGMVGRLVDDAASGARLARKERRHVVAVLVSPGLPDMVATGADIVVDARLAKRNIDTTVDDAPLVIGLGPGFSAGADCHCVIETMRGHHLGRVIWSGSAAADTGVPGEVGGHRADRVLRAPTAGSVRWSVGIGEQVVVGQGLGSVGDEPIHAPIEGLVRGLVVDGLEVGPGMKIGDVDPRTDPSACHEISDKALAIGGGVVEAVGWFFGQQLGHRNRDRRNG